MFSSNLSVTTACILLHPPSLQAAKEDRFRGHECGQYREVTANPQLVIDCLAEAGEKYFSKWLRSW